MDTDASTYNFTNNNMEAASYSERACSKIFKTKE